MITLPNLVQDFNIRHLTGSVLVGTMKFTLDQFDAFFTAQNPAPAVAAAEQTRMIPIIVKTNFKSGSMPDLN